METSLPAFGWRCPNRQGVPMAEARSTSFGLQQQKSIISEVWRPEVQTQGAGGAMLPGGSKGIFSLLL